MQDRVPGPVISPGAVQGRTPGALQGIMLLLPITMAVMGISVLTPIVPLLLQQFPGNEYLVMGGVITMPAIWVLLFSPAAGWLADRLGRRNLLVASMVVYAFAGVAPAFLDDLYAIIASRVAVGICESIVMTVSTTLISDYFRGHARERWLASQTAVASLSALGIIYLGGQLGAAHGWRGPFYLYAYSLPLALGLRLTVWEPAGTGGEEDGADDAAVRHRSVPWARLAGICGITVLASIAFYTVITKNAQALNTLGVTDSAEIAKLTMLASIGVPLGTFVFWALSRLPIGWLLCVDFALVGIGFACMGHAGDADSYSLRTFINQLGCGLMLPTMLVWATRGLAYSIRGFVNGLWQASFVIGQFLSGMVVTWLSHVAGGLLPTLVAMGWAFMGFAAIAAVAGFLRRRPAAAPGAVENGAAP
ncbi:MAG TPA: MFS transporter [Steroidobacteraceae bacterium]|jgi:MFS family permease|nr:MFS transporter [Steroidobacteraceae bacterium]